MIDYKIIDASNDYYESLGYKRIESPWTVSPGVDNLTKPENRPHLQLKHNDKCLVASGEQSFLYLILKGFIPNGKYQTTTPCFRYESFDDLHTKYFIKTELINTENVTQEQLYKTIYDAKEFFSHFLNKDKILLNKINDDQIDLEYNGIELGSYGIRECSFTKWIYGTGVAEPRLSTILTQIQNGWIS